jgi:hypothetical protein
LRSDSDIYRHEQTIDFEAGSGSFKINVWINPDKALKYNAFVGPLGKIATKDGYFGLRSFSH